MEAVEHSNLTGIAIVALAALLCGIGMERLKQPAIVGYIVAGVLLGPSAFQVVASTAQVDILAELGVLMLLFLVGMELSLRSFRRMWRIAVLVTAAQIAVPTAAMVLLSRVLGWSYGMAVLVGFALALSSTAVAVKILEDAGELRTRAGRITVGVLIAQDLAVVPMMLALGAFAGDGLAWFSVLKIALSLALLAGLIGFLSRGRKVRLPFAAVVAGHADLKPLAALAFCFGAAALTGLIGLSAPYGAFLAGLVIGNSSERNAMIEASRPIQSVLIMVFFVSIGLLLDLGYVWRNLGTVLMLFLLVAVFKTALNVGALRLLGQSWPLAFLSGAVMAQIGEFSFLLSLLGVASGVIGREDSRLIVAVTVLSLVLSPLWLMTARRVHALARQGIGEADELLRLLYGREAEFVAETFDDARSRLRVLAWRLGQWRKERKEKRVVHAAPPSPTTTSDDGKVVKLRTGTDDAGPSP
jgi:CPA2 family monovalent cation:H+ antiporter-2